jgi:hypothetical protein
MKKSKILYESLLREIKQTPKLDIHTHVKPAAPQARSLTK